MLERDGSARDSLGGRGSVFKAPLAAELAQSQRRDLADQRPKLVLAQAADPLVQLLELVSGSCHLALPGDRFAGLLPALFVAGEGIAVADDGFDQLGQCVGEASAAIVAEDVRMLVEEHGQRSAKSEVKSVVERKTSRSPYCRSRLSWPRTTSLELMS